MVTLVTPEPLFGNTFHSRGRRVTKRTKALSRGLRKGRSRFRFY